MVTSHALKLLADRLISVADSRNQTILSIEQLLGQASDLIFASRNKSTKVPVFPLLPQHDVIQATSPVPKICIAFETTMQGNIDTLTGERRSDSKFKSLIADMRPGGAI